MHQLRSPEHGRSILGRTASLLVLAPHPDDEILACAGLLREAAAAGLPCLVVFLTNGEAHEAACAVAACRRSFRPLGGGLRGGAVRILLGTRESPEARVVVAAAGRAAEGASVRLVLGPELEGRFGVWKTLNQCRWASLPAPIGIPAPVVQVLAEDGLHELRTSRTIGFADRLALGRARGREARAALRSLGTGISSLFLGLGDGQAARWWNAVAGEAAGPGVSAFDRLTTAAFDLPGPVTFVAPSEADRDPDHRGAAALAGSLVERMRSRGCAAEVYRYLVHHPDGEDAWLTGTDAAGLPPFDISLPVDAAWKRTALRHHASQLRADFHGRLVRRAGAAEQFWLE